jgi:predicted nucleic acid-binding protein
VPVPPQLYLDTSVIGGYFDAEFEQDTRELWRQQEQGLWVFVTSALVAQEVERAPADVRQLFGKTFGGYPELLEPSPAEEALAEAYIAAGVLTDKSGADAMHVALCSCHSIDYLVSWNYKHLVNADRAAGFNRINDLRGHPAIRIVSPKELIHGRPTEEDL